MGFQRGCPEFSCYFGFDVDLDFRDQSGTAHRAFALPLS